MAQSFRTEFADLETSGSLAIENDLYVNRNGSNGDTATIYFNGTNASIEYQGNVFTLSKSIYVNGQIDCSGDMYVGGGYNTLYPGDINATGNLTISNASLFGGTAVIDFGDGGGTLRVRSSLSTLSTPLTVSGSFKTTGDVYIDGDASSTLSTLWFRGTKYYLQFDNSDNSLNTKGDFIVNGTLEVNGGAHIGSIPGSEYIWINDASGPNTSTHYIYFDVNQQYLKYRNSLFQFSTSLNVSGSLKTTGQDVYINADTTSSATRALLWFNGTRGRFVHENNNFGVNGSFVSSGSLVAYGDIYINKDDSGALSTSSLYFNNRTASIKYSGAVFIFSNDTIVTALSSSGDVGVGDSKTITQVSTVTFAGGNHYIRYSGTSSPRRFQTSTHMEVVGSGSFTRLISPSGTTLPTVSSTGTVFFDTSTNRLYVKNGTTWKSVLLA